MPAPSCLCFCLGGMAAAAGDLTSCYPLQWKSSNHISKIPNRRFLQKCPLFVVFFKWPSYQASVFTNVQAVAIAAS